MTHHSTPHPAEGSFGPDVTRRASLTHPSWYRVEHDEPALQADDGVAVHGRLQRAMRLRLGAPNAVGVEVALSQADYVGDRADDVERESVDVVISEVLEPNPAEHRSTHTRLELLTLSTPHDALALGQAIVEAAQAALAAVPERRAG